MIHVLTCDPTAGQASASELPISLFARILLALQRVCSWWIGQFFMYTLGSEARNPLYIGWWLLKLDRAHFRIRGAREGPSCWLMDLEDWVKRQRWFSHSNVV